MVLITLNWCKLFIYHKSNISPVIIKARLYVCLSVRHSHQRVFIGTEPTEGARAASYYNRSQYGLVGNPVLFLFVLYCIRCAWFLTDVVRMVPGLTLFEKFQLGRLWKGVLIMSLVWFCIVVLLRWGGPSFQRLGLSHRRTFYNVLNIIFLQLPCCADYVQQRGCDARPSEARASPKIL